jgi:Family of unknown function (DUF6346)
MEPPNDRIAKRLEQIKAQEAALEETVDRRVADADPGASIVNRRKAGALRSAVFLVAVLIAAAGLLGVAVTLNRLAGDDFAEAKRLGRAQVTSCIEHGPVSSKGFGYWESCTATITWDDGDVDRLTVGGVFRSSDLGAEVRVGDLGNYRTSKELARSDAPHRPWLAWIGYAAGVIAFLPALVGTLAVRELLRFRRL